jgi:NADPH:quinone reductase-like Zn-dependent oxidoreductase
MRAFVRTAAESGDVKLIERALPRPAEGEVLVAMHGFGVGIHDRSFIPQHGPFPYTIGTEGAGVVVAIGAGITSAKVGDRVMLMTIMQPQGGTWAEFAVAPATAVFPIPDNMDFRTAAGLQIPGDAAIAALRTLDLSSGTTLFVGGGSGAIGTLLIQLASQRGIRVAASASPNNHAYLRSLGADLPVDYRDSDWPEAVRQWAPGGVDAVLAILPGIAGACMAVIRDGGKLVTVSGDTVSPQRGIHVEQFQHLPEDRKALAQLADEIAAGRVRMVLERVYDFEDALAALEKTETRHARGKLVVTVEPSQVPA